LPAAEQVILRGRDAEIGAQLWTESWTLTRRLSVDPPILDVVVEGAGLRETRAPWTWMRQLTIDLWGLDPRRTATEEVRDPQGHPYQSPETARRILHIGGVASIPYAAKGRRWELTHPKAFVQRVRQGKTPAVLPDRQRAFELSST
jgi:hypothetical protein